MEKDGLGIDDFKELKRKQQTDHLDAMSDGSVEKDDLASGRPVRAKTAAHSFEQSYVYQLVTSCRNYKSTEDLMTGMHHYVALALHLVPVAPSHTCIYSFEACTVWRVWLQGASTVGIMNSCGCFDVIVLTVAPVRSALTIGMERHSTYVEADGLQDYPPSVPYQD